MFLVVGQLARGLRPAPRCRRSARCVPRRRRRQVGQVAGGPADDREPGSHRLAVDDAVRLLVLGSTKMSAAAYRLAIGAVRRHRGAHRLAQVGPGDPFEHPPPVGRVVARLVADEVQRHAALREVGDGVEHVEIPFAASQLATHSSASRATPREIVLRSAPVAAGNVAPRLARRAISAGGQPCSPAGPIGEQVGSARRARRAPARPGGRSGRCTARRTGAVSTAAETLVDAADERCAGPAPRREPEARACSRPGCRPRPRRRPRWPLRRTAGPSTTASGKRSGRDGDEAHGRRRCSAGSVDDPTVVERAAGDPVGSPSVTNQRAARGPATDRRAGRRSARPPRHRLGRAGTAGTRPSSASRRR